MRAVFEPIGFVQSCFKEKFGIPRQPLLIPEADGAIVLKKDPDLKTALRGLESFSHLWVIFVFHEHGGKKWKPSIRPPRLGGAKKVGVLASRSPHRPNPIGMSVVKLRKVDLEGRSGPIIYIQGGDLLDGTPVLDIKPYLPYADSIADATSGWASQEIERSPVKWSDTALASLKWRDEKLRGDRDPRDWSLKRLIEGIFELDPRPAFQKRRSGAPGECIGIGSSDFENLSSAGPAQPVDHGFNLFDFDVKWRVEDGAFLVTDLADL